MPDATYYAAHREEYKASARAYYDTHRDQALAGARQWRADNPERCKELYDANNAAHRDDRKAKRDARRMEVVAHYGGKCACCGEARPQFLAIDHINGDGNKHRKEVAANIICNWLIKNHYPDGFRILCHNCNMARGLYGKCPHETEVNI